MWSGILYGTQRLPTVESGIRLPSRPRSVDEGDSVMLTSESSLHDGQPVEPPVREKEDQGARISRRLRRSAQWFGAVQPVGFIACGAQQFAILEDPVGCPRQPVATCFLSNAPVSPDRFGVDVVPLMI